MSDLQLTLPLAKYVTPTYDKGLSHLERYRLWVNANPWVIDAFEQLAEDELANGARKIGVKYLAEVLRWHHNRAMKTADFYLNNNHTAFVARDLLARRPEWASHIDLREQRAA